MTEHEAKDMLQAKLICLELDSDVEGCDGDCEGCEYNYTQGTFREQKEALKVAIKTLEKQIPKKILYEEQYYGTPWLCPECEADQIEVEFFTEDGYEPKDKYSYCWKCGQKLDWSVEE